MFLGLRCGRSRQVGDGRKKSPSCFAMRESDVCVLSGGASPMCTMARADSRGFYSFLFGLRPARLGRLLTPKLAAAEGEQDVTMNRRPFDPLFMGSCT